MRWAAQIDGATEGLLESFERYHLTENAQDAVHESGRLIRSAAEATRDQAQTPEGRRLARDARQGAHAAGQLTSEAADAIQDRVSQTAENVLHTMDEAEDYMEQQWLVLKETMTERAQRVQHAAQVTAAEAQQRGRYLAQAGRRAAQAPSNVASHMKHAFDSWRRGMASGAGLLVAAGVVGLTAFIVLTIAMVNWLNALVGAPGGTFLVALLYGIIAAGAVYGAKKARSKGRKQSKEHMDDARAELMGVAQPVRQAFAGHRVTRSQEPSRRPNIGAVKTDQDENATAPAPDNGDGSAQSIDPMEWKRR